MTAEGQQKAVCERHGTAFDPPSGFEKVGIALSTLHLEPLNGLRHRPEGGTSGWYIWGGSDLSTAPDFFQPLLSDNYISPSAPITSPHSERRW